VKGRLANISINTRSYLTKKEIRNLFWPWIEWKNDLGYYISHLISMGYIEKCYTYYRPTIKLLKELGLIPDKIEALNHNKLSTQQRFRLYEIQEIYKCSKDTAHVIVDKYFYTKDGLHYKTDTLIDLLCEGIKEIEL